ncbi:hypothetical protein [Nocardioides sp. SYSU DS0663]|uniref:hypothetical protein n=1 Tax=Nocardioides sp. SYSU DS0663 TaxID=3416445 RepID=UPI003F4C1F0C
MSTRPVELGGLSRLADPNVEAWQVALDRLELDLARLEKALGLGTVVDTDPWEVPEQHGPLPLVLQPRASELLARQEAVIETIRARMDATLRERETVDARSRGSVPAEPRAAYIDLTA